MIQRVQKPYSLDYEFFSSTLLLDLRQPPLGLSPVPVVRFLISEFISPIVFCRQASQLRDSCLSLFNF